jgi:putative ABC transport system permease protein
MMSMLLHDLRFAIRLLARDRTFTVTALLTLALSIAANTAMFGIVRSVLLRPLPFPDSHRVVLLYNSYPDAGAPRAGTSVPDYYDRIAAVPALDEFALYRPETMTYGDENGVERLTSLRATPSFYRLVGVTPAYGRLFRDDEGERGRALKVILSDGFLHRKFGGNPAMVGRTIRLNGNTFEVVGVMPAGFTFLQNAIDVFVPSPIGPADRRDDMRHTNNWQMLGRLKPGATIAQVAGQIDALNAANDARFPEFHQILKDARFHTVVVRLRDDVVRDVKGVLYLLSAGVGFVLLIGCANLANLVIVRAHARSGEMATRHAIGGGIGRLARQVLTETMLLSLAGSAAGLFGGWWMLRSVASLDLDRLPRAYEVRLDALTVAVVIGLALVVGLALGIAPVLGLGRMNLNAELQAESRGSTSSRRAAFVRRALAVAQVAIAFVLLVGAGLLLASFRAVLRLDLGFRPERVVTATINLPATAYREQASLVGFGRRALAALRARPEVEAAGLVTSVPFSGSIDNSVIMAEGHIAKPGESLIAPSQIVATPGYFEAMRIPVVRGRGFDNRDRPDGPLAVVVDERLARRFWGDADPIGRRLYFPEDPKDVTKIAPDTHFFTVVGVVRGVQAFDPRADVTPIGTFYLSFDQVTARGVTFVVRSRVAAASMLNAIRHEVSRIDPQLPVFRTRPMQEWIDRALVNRRVPMLVAAAFAVAALLLSAIGIYGVLAYSVTQRRREMGVRLALGSTTTGIFRLVLGEGVRIIAAGLVAGGFGSLFIGRLMTSQLYGVGTVDPLVIAAVALVLSGIALVAIAIPSWRASGIDPVAVLGK